MRISTYYLHSRWDGKEKSGGLPFAFVSVDQPLRYQAAVWPVATPRTAKRAVV